MQVNVITKSHGHVEFDDVDGYSFDQGYLFMTFEDGTAHVPEENIAWVRVYSAASIRAQSGE